MTNKELIDYCDKMRDLFATDGWLHIEDELTNLHRQTRDIETIATVEQLHFNKGVAHAASIILNLPESVKDLEESLEADK